MTFIKKDARRFEPYQIEGIDFVLLKERKSNKKFERILATKKLIEIPEFL